MSRKHLIVHKYCNGPAFWYAHLPVSGEKIVRTHTTLLDGTTPIEGDILRCGNCKQQFRGGNELMPAMVYDISNPEHMETIYGPYHD